MMEKSWLRHTAGMVLVNGNTVIVSTPRLSDNQAVFVFKQKNCHKKHHMISFKEWKAQTETG